MEHSKHLDLLILITIRNSDKIPTDEFCTLFDHNWHVYSDRFNDLTNEGLFIHSTLEEMPGRDRYELTKKGELRIMELLTERSIEIDVKLAKLNHRKHSSQVRGRNIFLRIKGFITQISSWFTGKPSSDRELTITDKGNGLRAF